MLNEDEIKNPENLGPSRFTFNGNIISEIGEESISNPFIAIAELIKNSYDADSHQINLNFLNLDKHNPKIVLSDDGVGMDSSQIKDRWMDVGSPHKKEISITPENKRIPVGAKGIGRFASHCLGKSLNVITASKNEHFGYKLHFDWEKFSPKIKATDVDVDTQRFKKKLSTRGTTLIIDNLKQRWNEDSTKIKNLLRDTYLLTSPIDSPKSFKIKTNLSKDFSNLKRLDSEFLNKSAYHLSVRLKGKRNLEFDFHKNGHTAKINQKKELKEDLNCGEVSFDLYFYYKIATKWKERLNKNLTKKEMEEISSMLSEYGGIKLYRDKFRVKPYGDQDADWIGLDKWSRDQSIVPGNTQVIGIVSITKQKNPDIEDTTTREGVINSSAFFDLIKFVTTSVDLFVDLRSEEESDRVKARKSKKKERKAEKMEVSTPKVEERPVTVQEAPFIDVRGPFPSSHYNQCIYEANECENRNYPNAAFWLSRKIIENLVFHVLQKKYPKKIELWYDSKNKRNHSFSTLIDTLGKQKTDFPIHLQELINQFKTDVGTFKKDVDAAVHRNHVYLTNKTELQKYKISKIIQILVDIYNQT